ncbi:MAG TPA: DUF4145 domain-containing protein [Paludibacter sp.]|nr:DUF4145 domain-containing protein [Paludibacter sp.]
MKVSLTNIGYSVDFRTLPNKCPFCHNSITPDVRYGYRNLKTDLAELFMSCPNTNCFKTFIGYYKFTSNSYIEFNGTTSQGTLIGKEFSEHINAISPIFSTIYNEAYSAEQQNLKEICGVGYRKALEFLIKDYSVTKHADKKDKIEKDLLAKVIGDYVSDANIKSVAKRAVWLGNDETHYIRKWEGKDLNDLKKLIALTVHWIEMEVLTASFEEEMPENK